MAADLQVHNNTIPAVELHNIRIISDHPSDDYPYVPYVVT